MLEGRAEGAERALSCGRGQGFRQNAAGSKSTAQLIDQCNRGTDQLSSPSLPALTADRTQHRLDDLVEHWDTTEAGIGMYIKRSELH